jgi:hypothetical protein
VFGELVVDDIDATIGLLDTWQPPPVPLADRVRLRCVIAAACAIVVNDVAARGRDRSSGKSRKAADKWRPCS